MHAATPHPTHTPTHTPLRTQVNIIASLPILDLALLVAVHRVTAKGSEDLNFEMVGAQGGRAGRCQNRRWQAAVGAVGADPGAAGTLRMGRQGEVGSEAGAGMRAWANELAPHAGPLIRPACLVLGTTRLPACLQAHHEFNRYAVRADVDNYSREAAAKAWDHLLAEGLVAFVDPRCAALLVPVPRCRCRRLA